MPEDKKADEKVDDKQELDNDKQAESTPANFGEWLKAQPTDVQKLYNDEVAGLKSALSSERQQRKDNEAALRDAAAKVEKGSEAEKLLTEQADTLQGLELRAAFYDEAHTQGVTNLKLAWMAAQEADAFDRRGNVNWESLRTQFPELFAKTTMIPSGDAGKGTKTTPAGDGKDMNTFIRTSAGR
ncbi:MAG: hypothetical protein ABIH23_33730 [bacterium]